MYEYISHVVTHPLFALATGLAGFLIGHRLQLIRDHLRNFNAAAERFREAFNSELFHYSPEIRGRAFIHNIIIASEETHFAAYSEFLLHVPSLKRKGFSSAWAQYVKCRKAYDRNDTKEKRDAAVEDLYQSINLLLSYSRPR